MGRGAHTPIVPAQSAAPTSFGPSASELFARVTGGPFSDYVTDIHRRFHPSRLIQNLEHPDAGAWSAMYGLTEDAARYLAREVFSYHTPGNVEYERGAVSSAFAALLERLPECVEVRVDLPLAEVELEVDWRLPASQRRALVTRTRMHDAGKSVALWALCHRRQRQGVVWALRAYARHTWPRPSGRYDLKNAIYVPRSLRAHAAGTRAVPVGWIDLGNAYFFSVDERFFRRVVALLRGDPLPDAAPR